MTHPSIDGRTFGPVDATIDRVIYDRGFGFVTVDELGKDIFFHETALDGSLDFKALVRGSQVTVEYQNSAKGLRAVRVSARR